MATLVRWEPIREVAAMQTELSRLMNGLFEGNGKRTVGLPQGVSEDDIKASYADGVLQIHVPKPVQAKPKRIEVAQGGTEPQTIERTTS